MYLKLCKRCSCLVEGNQTGTRGFVFLNRYGNPITPGGIWGQLKNTMALAYRMNRSGSSSFFRTVLPKALSKNAEISLLSDLLTQKPETTRTICDFPAVSNITQGGGLVTR